MTRIVQRNAHMLASSLAHLRRDRTLESRLCRSLARTRTGRSVYAFGRVFSTMDIARQLAAEGCRDGTLIWASRQDQGRGRLGRSWLSPTGGAYFSLVTRPPKPQREMAQLSLIAGLGTAEAIQARSPLLPTIRWPNDVLIDGRKVAGILVESKAGAVVVGVGINVTTGARRLPDAATSLTIAGARNVDPVRMTGELCRRFERWYDVWIDQGFGPIREALRPWIGFFGQLVDVRAGLSRFEGTASDLDEAGRLLVRLDSGVIRAFDVGEVTLLRPAA